MLDTLIKSLQIKMTYRVNTIIYAIKQIPILKSIFSDKLYSLAWLKALLTVISIFREIIGTFIWKFIYVFLMIVFPLNMMTASEDALIIPEWGRALQVFFFLTLAGGLANNDFFTGSMDKYYSVILLRMDAKKHAISHYIYLLFRFFLGFTAVGIVAALICDAPIWQGLIIPFYVVAVKLIVSAIDVKNYEKQFANKDEKTKKYFVRTQGGTAIGYVKFAFIGVFLALAYFPVGAGLEIPVNIIVILMLVAIVLGIVSIFILKNFKNYRKMYKLGISEFMESRSLLQNANQEIYRKTIDDKTQVESNKSGFEFLNELFVKRHRKILWRATRNITIGIGIAVVLASALMLIVPDSKELVNTLICERLSIVSFVLYFMNRGQAYTRALFSNCDCSLLTYPVYRKGSNILKLFRLRLLEISKVNLVPAAALAAGLALLLFISGGPENPSFYLVVIVSVIAFGIFFSVHYLAMYYLLQPFNVNTEVKSGLYNIVVGITYAACYIMMYTEVPTKWFALIAVTFCIIYSIVASILAYTLAPKTFKIRY